jgi:hypothetical protein
MAAATKQLFPGTKFGIGPPIEVGFYYDLDVGDYMLTAEDLQKIEERMYQLAAKDDPYVREEKKWEDAVAYFKEKKDPYKIELLDELKGQTITFYHSGDFTDLCYGPHLPSAGRIKAIKLLSIAGAYWRGNEKNKMLQRIYGVKQNAGTIESLARNSSSSCSPPKWAADFRCGSRKGRLFAKSLKGSCAQSRRSAGISRLSRRISATSACIRRAATIRTTRIVNSRRSR